MGDSIFDEEIAAFAVDYATSLGARYAEVRIQRDATQQYLVKNGQLETAGFYEDTGLSIRVLVDGSLGFASTDQWNNREAIKRIVNDAIKLARAHKRGDVSLSSEETYIIKYEVKSKIDPRNIDLMEKIGYLLELDKIIQEADENAKYPNRMLSISETITDKFFKNSEGTEIISSVPRISFFVFFVTAVNNQFDTRFLQFGESRGWEAIKEWNLEDTLREEARSMATILREGKTPPEGEIDVVIGSEVSGLAAHECVGHPYEADRILGREGAQAGESFVDPDMLGKKVGSEALTVIDDPTLPNSYGFYLYDDEGVKARPRYLIHRGVIKEFLHNRETANRFGIKSNAAARASAYNREPIVRMANTYIAPGDYSFEELLEDIKLGIYMKSFGEWNIDDKRYNMRFVGKESWLIRNGELTEPVRNPILEITTPGFYRSIDAVDKNLEFYAATCGKGDPGQGVPVWVGGPNVRLRGIRVLKL